MKLRRGSTPKGVICSVILSMVFGVAGVSASKASLLPQSVAYLWVKSIVTSDFSGAAKYVRADDKAQLGFIEIWIRASGSTFSANKDNSRPEILSARESGTRATVTIQLRSGVSFPVELERTGSDWLVVLDAKAGERMIQNYVGDLQSLDGSALRPDEVVETYARSLHSFNIDALLPIVTNGSRDALKSLKLLPYVLSDAEKVRVASAKFEIVARDVAQTSAKFSFRLDGGPVEEINLVRVDARWYVELQASAKAPAAIGSATNLISNTSALFSKKVSSK